MNIQTILQDTQMGVGLHILLHNSADFIIETFFLLKVESTWKRLNLFITVLDEKLVS